MTWEPGRVEVASSGLTTASTAYTAGDQVGAKFVLAAVAGANNGYGAITGIELVDYAKALSVFNLWIFRDDPTAASNNAAFSVSDADADKLIAGMPISFTSPQATTNNAAVGKSELWIPYQSGSGHDDLWALIETRANHTFFGAVTDLRLKVDFLKWV